MILRTIAVNMKFSLTFIVLGIIYSFPFHVFLSGLQIILELGILRILRHRDLIPFDLVLFLKKSKLDNLKKWAIEIIRPYQIFH